MKKKDNNYFNDPMNNPGKQKKYNDYAFRAFLSLVPGAQKYLLQNMIRQIENKRILYYFCTESLHFDGAKQYLLRKGIISFPDASSQLLISAVLCDGYVINEKYELER